MTVPSEEKQPLGMMKKILPGSIRHEALCHKSPHVTYWHSIQKDIAFTTLCAGVVSTLVVVTQLLPHTTSTESQEKAGDGGAAPQWPRGNCAPHCASACHCTVVYKVDIHQKNFYVFFKFPLGQFFFKYAYFTPKCILQNFGHFFSFFSLI